MAFLTDQLPATGINLTDLFHIVNPFDISQGNPAGSSYKVRFEQIYDAIILSGINVTEVTTSGYTATTSFTYYGVTYSGETFIKVPSATNLDGFILRIKDERGTASSYRIRITPISGNIDNNSYVDMNINNMSLTLVARNNNWWIV